nr:hypothetical protein GCM10020185_55990 [Pseudomonas brassicacearum subsp. brassicacearum]
MTAEQRAQEHELAEAKAYKELREMEGSIDGAHFLEKNTVRRPPCNRKWNGCNLVKKPYNG